MGKVYACVGRYAASPYTIKKACINIYCVEELCYYIENNGFFVDEDFFDNALYSWLEEECDLLTLSKELRRVARTEKKVEAVARHLLEYVHYTSEEDIEATVELIRGNRDMPANEKLKSRADYFLRNEKYGMALKTYEELLTRLDERKDLHIMVATYHNIGVVYARMFLFSEATVFFEKAYELSKDEEHMIALLASYRMIMSEQQYLKKITSYADKYRETAILEERRDQALAAFKNSEELKKVELLKGLKKQGNVQEFQRQSAQQVAYIKESYRNQIGY